MILEFYSIYHAFITSAISQMHSHFVEYYFVEVLYIFHQMILLMLKLLLYVKLKQ